MAFRIQLVASLMALLYTQTECNLYNFLTSPSVTPYSSSGLLDSFASQVPGSSMNTIDGRPPGSNLPPPEPPQVLRNALTHAPPNTLTPPPSVASPMSLTPPLGAASPTSPVARLMNLVSSFGSPSQGPTESPTPGTTRQKNIPVVGKMKQMVNKWATQLGHKAWYEAHGCVDPASVLHGKHGRVAAMAMMMGCSNPQANEYCELAQMSYGGTQAARSRMLMEIMMPKQLMGMFEQCLTPSTLMSSFTSLLQGGGGGGGYPYNSYGMMPPHGAAGNPAQSSDCSAVSPMLMLGSGGGEGGMLSHESLENIGRMRNRYLKMQCQENIMMGNLPFRMCCPGRVQAPTMQEAMMVKSMMVGA